MRGGNVDDHFSDCIQGLMGTIAWVIDPRGVSGARVEEMPMKKKQCTVCSHQIRSIILRDKTRVLEEGQTVSLERLEHRIFRSCPHAVAAQLPERTAVFDHIQ